MLVLPSPSSLSRQYWLSAPVSLACMVSCLSHVWPSRLLCPWDSPGKNTRLGCHSLLQGIFPTQGSNRGLLLCRWILYHLSHQGSPLCAEEEETYSSFCCCWPLPATSSWVPLLVLSCSLSWETFVSVIC